MDTASAVGLRNSVLQEGPGGDCRWCWWFPQPQRWCDAAGASDSQILCTRQQGPRRYRAHRQLVHHGAPTSEEVVEGVAVVVVVILHVTPIQEV